MIKASELKYTYDGGKIYALNGIDLRIEQGSFVAIIGANASGKSTFARHCNALLLPSEGKLWLEAGPEHILDTADESVRLLIRQNVGLVFQNPDNQMLADVVEEDVAFGLCNLELPSEEIGVRVREALQTVGMEEYASRTTHKLSGGQKQLVALAGILAMRPRCIVLDEATAMLDPAGREAILGVIGNLRVRYGTTVILITHHMNEAAIADRVLVLDQGRIAMDGRPCSIFCQIDELRACGLAAPPLSELAYELSKEGCPIPLGTPDFIVYEKALRGIMDVQRLHAEETIPEIQEPEIEKSEIQKPGKLGHGKSEFSGEAFLRLERVGYTYDQGMPFAKEALREIDLDIFPEETVVLLGKTGSGKSTLLQHLNGLLRPTAGRVLLLGKDIHENGKLRKYIWAQVGLVFQYPEHQLFEATAGEDIAFGPRRLGLPESEVTERVRRALDFVGLDESYARRFIRELSDGQKRRIALAGVIALEPRALVLDEPTAGLDPKGSREILERLKVYQQEKKAALVLASHNLEDIAPVADRLIVLQDGAIARDTSAEVLFNVEDAELNELGLNVPEIPKLMRYLARRGLPVKTGALTVGQAASEIGRCCRRQAKTETEGAV